MLLVLVGFGIIYSKQNELLNKQKAFQKTQIEQQAALAESIRKNGLVVLMGKLLEKVESELDQNNKRLLSNETIARIADLSHAFVPEEYIYIETDSTLQKKPSIERGMLLLALSQMKIDSVSFKKIKKTTSFAGADLTKANLPNIDLSEADLKCAIFKEANFQNADFQNADLRGTNFWGANLNHSNLKEAKLNRANMNWTELNDADLSKADLRDINFQSAKLRNTNLHQAQIRTGNLSNSICENANFTEVDLKDANLSGANLENTIFTKADLRRTNLSETYLDNTNLTDVKLTEAGIFTSDWFQMLTKWHVIGADSIQKKYKIADKVYGETNFEIAKIE